MCEVLKFSNSTLRRGIASFGQVYSDSLVFLALRKIHRHPLSLNATQTHTGLHASSFLLKHPQFNSMRAESSERSSGSPPPTSPPPPSPPSSSTPSLPPHQAPRDLRPLHHRLPIHQTHEVRQGRAHRFPLHPPAGSQVRRLQLPPHQALRTVQTHLLLLPLLPETSLEEAQEDVQSPNHPSRNRGRPPRPPQGHCPPKYVHTDTWDRGWTFVRCGGVPVARSSVLMIKKSKI